MTDYTDYRVTFDSLFSQNLTTEEARHILRSFDKKLKEVSGQGRANVVEMASRLWWYFGSPDVPERAKLVAGVALLYFILPYDLIPDVTVFFGYVDDLAMMAIALRKLTTLAGMAKSSRETFRGRYGV